MKRVSTESVDAPIDELQPHPENPNDGDVGAVVLSMQANGFYGRIIAQASTRYILAGTTRWRAAKQLGFETVPVDYVDVDDVTAKRILAADNRIARLSTLNDTDVFALLGSLKQDGVELLGTGYDDEDFASLFQRLNPAPKHKRREPAKVLRMIYGAVVSQHRAAELRDLIGAELWRDLLSSLNVDEDPCESV